MAVEPERWCGYRKAGGLYLVGDAGPATLCDRLPLAIVPCPSCGEAPRFHRSISGIRPRTLWGNHLLRSPANQGAPPGPCVEAASCEEKDPLCQPPETGWLMWVGKEYTTASFRGEAERLGISKRIPAVPKGLVLDHDWVYLAKPRLVPETAQMWFPGEAEEGRGFGPGVFEAFQPTRIEKVVTDLTPLHELEELRVLGITPVVVPHDDPDHR